MGRYAALLATGNTMRRAQEDERGVAAACPIAGLLRRVLSDEAAAADLATAPDAAGRRRFSLGAE